MSDATPEAVTVDAAPVVADKPSMTGLGAIVYYLMLAGFVTGITWLVAGVLAYAGRESYVGEVLESHRRFQIRTFWWSTLSLLALGVCSWVVLGVFAFAGIYALVPIWIGVEWLIGIVVVVWTLYRVIIGLVRWSNGRQI